MPRKEEKDQEEENWVDECDQDEYDVETEEERKSTYNNMCSDEDEHEPVDYLNNRYKRRIVKSVVVNLPMLASDSPHQETPPAEDETPKLKLPSGGWSVQKMSVADISSDTPTLSDSKLKVGKKKFSFGRTGEWKKMADLFSGTGHDLAEVPPPFETQQPAHAPQKVEEAFVKVEKRSRERAQRPLPVLDVPVPAEAPRNLKCTKMCNAGKDCKRRPECNYAHSMDEFNPVTCKFQSRCKNVAECNFKHDFETKEAFLARSKALPKFVPRKGFTG